MELNSSTNSWLSLARIMCIRFTNPATGMGGCISNTAGMYEAHDTYIRDTGMGGCISNTAGMYEAHDTYVRDTSMGGCISNTAGMYIVF